MSTKRALRTVEPVKPVESLEPIGPHVLLPAQFRVGYRCEICGHWLTERAGRRGATRCRKHCPGPIRTSERGRELAALAAARRREDRQLADLMRARAHSS